MLALFRKPEKRSMTSHLPLTTTHWGTYRARIEAGRLVELHPFEHDPDPSPIGRSIPGVLTDAARVRRPAIRRSYLEKGIGAGGSGRGSEPFVEVSWEKALDIAAAELARIKRDHGNEAIFGGSYGWASAGRFHHAQSQLHRFLKKFGGYTRSVHSYSYGAAEVILPHVIGTTDGVLGGHTDWETIADNSQLFVMFGGMPGKNSQVHGGGIGSHSVRDHLAACKRNGTQFVSISPFRDDAPELLQAEWLSARPNTDTAVMLGLAHSLVLEDLHDKAFLVSHCDGFKRFRCYLMGDADGQPKDAGWAATISGIPREAIVLLARRMAARRTMIAVSWSIQRGDHGEQPYWMAIALAAMLGQIGLPGGGFGFGYGSTNGVGNHLIHNLWPSLPQGTNPIHTFIPVARISDMLLNPGSPFDFNGSRYNYPDVRLVYWAGGNPFHHHQDINKLIRALHRPETIIAHEPWWTGFARHADIVFPITTQFERNDFSAGGNDDFLLAMPRLIEPVGEARDDFQVFCELAERLGFGAAFSEHRTEADWLHHLYAGMREKAAQADIVLPDFDRFWNEGYLQLPRPDSRAILLSEFRADPGTNPLATPSGKIEIFSKTIDGFKYDDCPGHPAWLEPKEWLGSENTERFPLHLLSNQPHSRLHSQYDNGIVSREGKISGREPMIINSDDAAARGIRDGDIVRVFNDRGSCLAAAVLSDSILHGTVLLATGAWYDPLEPSQPGSLEIHGNPNVLTLDKGASKLSQAPTAQSTLVQIERYIGDLPPIRAFDPPLFSLVATSFW